MSLGAGALKVSGGPNAISREEVSMATLDCAVILHGTVEQAEASFCENAASESASVLIQSW